MGPSLSWHLCPGRTLLLCTDLLHTYCLLSPAVLRSAPGLSPPSRVSLRAAPEGAQHLRGADPWPLGFTLDAAGSFLCSSPLCLRVLRVLWSPGVKLVSPFHKQSEILALLHSVQRVQTPVPPTELSPVSASLMAAAIFHSLRICGYLDSPSIREL